MDELSRLKELKRYCVMDSTPEPALDEIVEIALSICDTPISLLSFVDGTRQWFKASKGIKIKEAPRKYSFCQYILHHPDEILVVENPLQDERFKNNPFVQGPPQFRFYAGAPLKTPEGNVLGTLCVIDHKPNKITEKQKNALRLLAHKAMEYFDHRRLLLEQEKKAKRDAERLKKLTDLVPGILFQFEISPQGKKSFSFISKGISNVHPGLKPETVMENPEIAFRVIHPDDIKRVRESVKRPILPQPWNVEFRVNSHKGTVWYWGIAIPEKKKNGTLVWYGTIQNITGRKAYEEVLEQILFDISHVLRKPVTTMLGITALIEEENLDEELLRQYARNLKAVSEEMDAFTTTLNQIYSRKMALFVSED